ncbi:PPE family protein [Mycobacterium seoulense]|uniref:PPE family protein n=1 Tax=Mycobacterium seoulense TaxID=386911 RepID=UPI003CF989F1
MLPPEVNSARMYSGAGAGPMLAAASAWNGLAAELRAGALSYGSVLAALASEEWFGPASASMVEAASSFVAWMGATAGQAEQTAAQAVAAAEAYEIAFAATVPPLVIAENRARLAALTATNVLGQNTPAIAATEAQYAEMWAQDAVAMYGYAGASAIASQLSPFVQPHRTINPSGLMAQSAAVDQAVATAAEEQPTKLSQLVSALPSALQELASPSLTSAPADITNGLASGGDIFAPGSGNVTTGPLGFLNAIFGSDTAGGKLLNSGLLNTIAGSGLLAPANTVGPFVSLFGTGGGTGAAGAASADAATSALSLSGAATGPSEGMGGIAGMLSGGVGKAAAVGTLSVPPSWTSGAPIAGQLASAVRGTPMDAPAPAIAAGMPGVPFGTMAGQGFGRAVPHYGFRPTVIARPPAGG